VNHIGIGAYAGFQPKNIVEARLFVRRFLVAPAMALCMFAPQVAEALRELFPEAYIINRPDDGDDAGQMGPGGWYGDLGAAAAHYCGLIDLRLADAAPGTYQGVLGPCEHWAPPHEPRQLDWRAAIEYILCCYVQDVLGLDYICLNVPVANLEPADVYRFEKVLRKARWLGAHLYMGPGRTTLDQETDWCYSNRPWDGWLPEFRRLGIPMRLIATEMGTWANWVDSKLTRDQAAWLCVALERRWATRSLKEGVEWGGGFPFGFSTINTMENWCLDGAEAAFGTSVGGTGIPPRSGKVSLQQQFPAEWAAWIAAGGAENNFAKHAAAIGLVKITPAILKMLADESKVSAEQLRLALDKYPFPA